MNKKWIIIGVALFVALCGYLLFHTFIDESYAQDNNSTPKVVVECNKTAINSNETLTCSIKGQDFDYQVSSFSADVSLSDTLVLPQYSFDNSNWQGAVENGEIDLYTDVNKSGNMEFASFTVQAGSINTGANATISLSNVVVSNALFEEIPLSVDNVTIRIKSNVNTLSNLVVSSSKIVFDANTSEYYDEIDEDQIEITATKLDAVSTLTGDIGTQELQYGRNEFTITVTSESGVQKDYTIVINRPDKLIISDEVEVTVIDNVTYLSKISFDKTGADIKNKFVSSGQISIYDSNGNKLNDDSIVGTGGKVSIALSNETREYIIIILGDTTGDGKATVADVSKLFQHYRRTNVIPASQNYYILAGDVSADNEIKLSDVAKLFQYVRGKIASLD